MIAVVLKFPKRESVMKTLKNRYKNSKFQSKLMIIFVLTALLPIALILTVSFVLNAKNMTDKVDQLMINNLVRIADRTNLNLQIYTNSLYQMYQDELITENIKILMDNSSSQAVAYNQINNRLKQYNTCLLYTSRYSRCIRATRKR